MLQLEKQVIFVVFRTGLPKKHQPRIQADMSHDVTFICWLPKHGIWKFENLSFFTQFRLFLNCRRLPVVWKPEHVRTTHTMICEWGILFDLKMTTENTPLQLYSMPTIVYICLYSAIPLAVDLYRSSVNEPHLFKESDVHIND